MWRYLALLALVIFVLTAGVSIANAELLLTVNGLNPADSPLKIAPIKPVLLEVYGDTPFEPNGISVIATGATLVPVPDVNNQYRLEFDDEIIFANAFLIADSNISIDEVLVPEGTTVCQLFFFCNREDNVISILCASLSDLIYPKEEEREQAAPLVAELSVQSVISTNDTILIGEKTDSSYDADSYDPAIDLNGDGKIDFKDFAILAAEWLTTYDIYDLNTMCKAWPTTNPCNDINVSGPWMDQYFTGIGDCSPTICWEYGDDYSDFVWDNCGNFLYVVCTPTPELGYYCAYNYYFNGYFVGNRVGLCIYACGLNAFQVRKNASSSRTLQTRHRTQDNLSPGCDQGTYGKYDWQIVVYNSVTGQRTGYCRESYLDPNENEFWESDQGESSSCETVWW